MDKLKMQTPNFTDENIAKLAELFPNCVVESSDDKGQIKKSIDFDLLKQELSANIVEGPQERYHLNWPGKREALITANTSIAKTLRPCPEESVDFENTQNLFIEGDNLDALKLLQETYLGKVKMIYIDPPYNTGKDFIYADNFAKSTNEELLESGQVDEEGGKLVTNLESNGRFHSDWLSMMYSRLKLARNLLKDNGVIFISIDDGEIHNLKKLCDEIFGSENFLANIVWQKKTSPDARMNISPAHDHILLYAKQIELAWLNFLPLEESRKKSFTNPDNDPRGDWASVDLTGQTGRAPKSQFYTIKTPSGLEMPPPEGRCWALAERTFNELLEDNRIWFGKDGSNRPRLKKFLSESKGIRPWTWWNNKAVGHNQEGAQELKALFDDQTLFDNPKPTRLIKRIIQLSSSNSEEDIILDFFGGTATTAQALLEENASDAGNRKFIIIQLPEALEVGSNDYKANSAAIKAGYKNIAEISKERIRRAGKKIKEELGRRKDEEKAEGERRKDELGLFSDQATQPSSLRPHPLDIGFRVLKIDSSNMTDVYYNPDAVEQDMLAGFTDNIKEDRTEEDLLFQVLLDWGVDLTLPITKESISGQEVFFVDDNALAACFANDGSITDDFCKELAQKKPLRIVFRDSGFKDDSMKINVEQIFKLMSPHTEVKTI